MAETNPTDKNYADWLHAYRHLNAGLFGNLLPGCLLTFQRRRNAYGFYAGSRFEMPDQNTRADEIALNPRHFAGRPPREVLSTLAHEMCHQYQWHFGKRKPRGYHDKEWARLMIDIGLVPSNTGKPGGKATGRRVSHFIRDGGPFDRVCAELLNSGFRIPFVEADSVKHNGEGGKDETIRRKKAESKSRYTCPSCDPLIHVWGKPCLHIVCGECGAGFEMDASDDGPTE
jgi:SprT-like family